MNKRENKTIQTLYQALFLAFDFVFSSTTTDALIFCWLLAAIVCWRSFTCNSISATLTTSCRFTSNVVSLSLMRNCNSEAYWTLLLLGFALLLVLLLGLCIFNNCVVGLINRESEVDAIELDEDIFDCARLVSRCCEFLTMPLELQPIYKIKRINKKLVWEKRIKK